jgi:glutamate N-acetyltransferase/amino-acid N-acetyltransferase
VLREIAREVADVSFNGATVDGDTSTNDSFVLAATGRAAMPPITSASDARLVPIRAAIEACAVELAQAIVRDGEGATKFIAIRVEGGTSVSECKRVAFGIAHSPLVKTAFFASDPNLGRIVVPSAIRPTRMPIRRASRSGSTTCSWSTAAGARRNTARKTGSAS